MIRRFAKPTTLLIVLLSAATFAVSAEKFEQKVDMTFERIQEKAVKGDAHSQAILAQVFRRGEFGKEKRYDKAIEWAMAAAKKDEPLGIYNLAVIYDNGLGLHRQQVKALELFKKCIPGLKKQAVAGDIRAQYNLGYIFLKGKGTGANTAKAIEWFKMAAAQGDSDAIFSLGHIYQNKKNPTKNDLAEAMDYYRKAARKGHDQAQLMIGLMYLQGIGVEADPKEAAIWLLQSAAKGNHHAQLATAMLLETGKGVERNIQEALYWYRRSANQGNEQAIAKLKMFAAKLKKLEEMKKSEADQNKAKEK